MSIHEQFAVPQTANAAHKGIHCTANLQCGRVFLALGDPGAKKPRTKIKRALHVVAVCALRTQITTAGAMGGPQDLR